MIGVEFIYELKRIFRSNLFKLFTIFSIVGIITIQYTWNNFTMLNLPLVKWYYFWLPWNYSGLPFTIPCMNAFLFNFIQTLFIIFICTDNHRRKHEETLEALYVRPVSNTEITIGQGFGKVISITLLNLIVSGIALVSNIMYSAYAFDGTLYLFYWITLTFPTLVFILGLSILLGQIVKQQGLFILFMLFVVGIAGLPLFDWQHGLLDPFASGIPNVFSDVIGHVDLSNYMLQRVVIFLSGITFSIISIAFYPRLENTVHARVKIWFVGICFFILSMPFAWFYISRHNISRENQKYHTSLQKNTPKKMVDHIIALEIMLQEEKHGIKVECQLQITRLVPFDNPLVLYLNPGLKIDCLEQNGIPVKYTRDGQILITELHLFAGDTVNLRLLYHGRIDDNICNTCFSNTIHSSNRTNRIGIYQLGTHHIFNLEHYKLYTPESLWYPVCVIPARTFLQVKDFTRYSLTVYHREGSTAISQGIPERFINNKTVFHHVHALPALSLCIGSYNSKVIMVDSTCYEVYYLPEHEYIFKGFSKASESFIQEQIREMKQQLEYIEGTPSENIAFQGEREKKYDKIQCYPYEWLYLVETPISFCPSPGDDIEGEREYYGVVYLPENLITCNDFSYKEQNEEINEPRLSAQLQLFGYPRSSLLTSGPCSINSTMKGSTYFFYSERYPFIHEVLSSICKDMESLLEKPLDINRKINVINYLSKHSLQDAVESKCTPSFIKDILHLKTAELKVLIASRVEMDEFENFYRDFLFRHLFEGVQLGDFMKEAKNRIHLEMESILDEWYTSNRLASFVIKDFYIIYSDIDHKNLYSFKVFNRGEGKGVIMTDDNQTWHILPGESVEIKSWRHEEPFVIKPSYLAMPLSMNLPNILNPRKKAPSSCFDTTVGIRYVSQLEFQQDSTEIIVDNEDEGFKILERSWKDILLSNGKKGEKRYLQNRRLDRWNLLINQKYFGNPLRSAYMIGIGKGNHKVEWSTCLPGEGEYEIFYYYTPETEYSRNILADERNFIINDGIRDYELKLELDPQNQGWISLGIFYFKNGKTAKVTLSNKGNINRYMKFTSKKGLPQIVADAIKWTKIENKK